MFLYFRLEMAVLKYFMLKRRNTVTTVQQATYKLPCTKSPEYHFNLAYVARPSFMQGVISQYKCLHQQHYYKKVYVTHVQTTCENISTVASVMLIANYRTKISVGQLYKLGNRTTLSYESSALVLILKAIMP